MLGLRLHGSSLCFRLPMASSFVSLSLPLLSLMRTLVADSGSTQRIWFDLFSRPSVMSAKTLLLRKVTFTGSRDQDVGTNFLGAII